MRLSFEKAEYVFRKIKQLKEHNDLYCRDPRRLPVSVEDFQYVVADFYSLAITKLSVSFEAEHLRGMVERYQDGTARVLIRSDQPKEWQRFTAVKEIGHLAIDEHEDWSPRGVQTIEGLVREAMPEFDSNEEADSELQSEVWAEVVAFEVLYPFEFRAHDKEMLDRGEATIASLALHYEVPEFAVATALSTEYTKMATAMWGHVNAEE